MSQRVVLVIILSILILLPASQAALSLFEDRVLVFWLPPYCADLNPIERYWRHLKDLACANRLHAGSSRCCYGENIVSSK